jgi:hypothetical protein
LIALAGEPRGLSPQLDLFEVRWQVNLWFAWPPGLSQATTMRAAHELTRFSEKINQANVWVLCCFVRSGLACPPLLVADVLTGPAHPSFSLE